jgi:hypothetical protein
MENPADWPCVRFEDKIPLENHRLIGPGQQRMTLAESLRKAST